MTVSICAFHRTFFFFFFGGQNWPNLDSDSTANLMGIDKSNQAKHNTQMLACRHLPLCISLPIHSLSPTVFCVTKPARAGTVAISTYYLFLMKEIANR